MIVTRTPLRVSLAGGGSDLPAFCADEPGAVLSAAITRYMYITASPRFGSGWRVSYSQTEIVRQHHELQHDLARAALRWMNAEGGLEIVSVADVPAGTGLGSSSAYAVGLLLALYAHYSGQDKLPPHVLAQDAACVEIEMAGHPVGRQDHYAASFGGLRFYEFTGETVHASQDLAPRARELEKRLVTIYLGGTHDAGELSRAQAGAIVTAEGRARLRELVGIAAHMRAAVIEGRHADVGRLLNESWRVKRRAPGVTSERIDAVYARALELGALGGKVCGAGGAGFLLLYAEPEYHAALREGLGFPLDHLSFAGAGAQVVYRD